MINDYYGSLTFDELQYYPEFLYWEGYEDLYQVKVLSHCDDIQNNIISQHISDMIVKVPSAPIMIQTFPQFRDTNGVLEDLSCSPVDYSINIW